MAGATSIEQRVAILEREIAELKQRITLAGASDTWLERVEGSFSDEPDFDEVLRLGREIRQADRPDAEPERESP